MPRQVKSPHSYAALQQGFASGAAPYMNAETSEHAHLVICWLASPEVIIVLQARKGLVRKGRKWQDVRCGAVDEGPTKDRAAH